MGHHDGFWLSYMFVDNYFEEEGLSRDSIETNEDDESPKTDASLPMGAMLAPDESSSRCTSESNSRGLPVNISKSIKMPP